MGFPSDEPKLNGDAIGRAHSVSRESLSSTLSNTEVLQMIEKEQAKNRPYVASLSSGESSDEAGPISSLAISSQPSAAKRQGALSSRVGVYQAPGPDYRNTLRSQRSTHGKLALEQNKLPDVLKIGVPLPSSAEHGLEWTNQPHGKAQEVHNQDKAPVASYFTVPEVSGSLLNIPSKDRRTQRRQAQPVELAAPLSDSRAGDRAPVASFFTVPEVPGSLLNVPFKARRANRRQVQPVELAVPLSGSRTRDRNPKVSQQSEPIELPAAPVPGSRAKSRKVSPRSDIPLSLKPGYVEPNRALRLKPFAVPEIVITPPTPAGKLATRVELPKLKQHKPPNSSPSEKPTTCLELPRPKRHTRPQPPNSSSPEKPITSRVELPAPKQHTRAQPPNPMLNSKRGTDYQIMSAARSPTEIVRNLNGNLVPRYGDQKLPIVGIESPSRKQRPSVKRTSPSQAELPSTKTLFEFTKEYSARGKALGGHAGNREQDYAHYARCSSPTWNEVEVDLVDDEYSSHRQSWSSLSSIECFEKLVATEVPLVGLVHGPAVVEIAGRPSDRSLEQLSRSLRTTMGWPETGQFK